MKATLTFDLEELDDREAYMRCVKSLDLCLLLCDLEDGKSYEELIKDLELQNLQRYQSKYE